MADPEKVGAVIREWVLKADSDLEAARLLVRSGPKFPTEAVCFHAQQCVEKYLKAYLVFREIEFPRTHGIPFLLNLIPEGERTALSAADQVLLTAYATGIRYPGWIDLTPTEARYALRLARAVRSEVRKRLPRKVLRKQR
jgi:HEPN domain-containing protein